MSDDDVVLWAGILCYLCGKTVPMESEWRPMDIPPEPGYSRSVVNACADCIKARTPSGRDGQATP